MTSRPMPFLSELHANATENNISFVFFSGNDDSLIQHHGTEGKHPGRMYVSSTTQIEDAVIIQNMTFGGIQGFTRPPSTPWFDDDGEFAGIIHQERNLTYILINGAGHLASQWKPAQVTDERLTVDDSWILTVLQLLVMVREFVLGKNETGLLINDTTIGGENATLANPVLPGGTLFYFGSATTSGTSTVPAATASSWANFIRTATLTNVSASAATGNSSQTSSAAATTSSLAGSISASVSAPSGSAAQTSGATVSQKTQRMSVVVIASMVAWYII